MDTNDDKRTLSDLVKNVLDAQDACNLSGILHSFSEDIRRLRYIMSASDEGFSTDKLNRHPVCVLWSSKISSLTGSEVGLRFSRAYDYCVKVSQGEQPSLPVDAD